MRSRGEEGLVGPMPAVYARMGQATEDGELVPMIRDLLQVGGKFIIATIPFGEKQFGNEAQILIDGNHATWRWLVWRSAEGFKHWETQGYARGSKESSTVCFHDHFLKKSGLCTMA